MEDITNNQAIQTVIDPSTGIEDKSIEITSEQSRQPQTEDIGEQKHASLGKFKDSRELMSAYNNLEKEFTKRSQRLKSLEVEAIKAKASKDDNMSGMIKRMVELNPELGEIIAAAEQLQVPESCDTPLTIEDKVAIALKGKILPKDYEARQSYVDKIIEGDSFLKEQILSKALDKLPSFVSPKLNKYRGQTIITPPNRPQNLAEAGRLAEKIMNNRSR